MNGSSYGVAHERAQDISLVVVTPEMAKEWLANKLPNRPLKETEIRQYAAYMAAGKWKVNGETIIFDENGRLLDGQNRLTACERANVPFATYIVFGVSADNFHTIDTGSKRSAADVLNINGEPRAALLAAVLSLLHRYDSGQLESSIRRAPASLMPELLRLHPAARFSAKFAMDNGGPLLGSVCGFLHYLGTDLALGKTEDFLRCVQSGENIAKGQPAYALRNHLLTVRAHSAAALNQTVAAAIGIKALTAHLLDKAAMYVRWEKGTAFPVLPTERIKEYLASLRD